MSACAVQGLIALGDCHAPQRGCLRLPLLRLSGMLVGVLRLELCEQGVVCALLGLCRKQRRDRRRYAPLVFGCHDGVEMLVENAVSGRPRSRLSGTRLSMSRPGLLVMEVRPWGFGKVRRLNTNLGRYCRWLALAGGGGACLLQGSRGLALGTQGRYLGTWACPPTNSSSSNVTVNCTQVCIVTFDCIAELIFQSSLLLVLIKAAISYLCQTHGSGEFVHCPQDETACWTT